MRKTIALLLSLILALGLMACAAPEAPQGEEVTFTFIAVDPDGKETTTQVTTTKTIVGEALVEQGIIAGEEGPYGLYIKTVNGLTLDYDTDGMYWSFYIGDDYALTGVDQTPIDPSLVYKIVAEKA